MDLSKDYDTSVFTIMVPSACQSGKDLMRQFKTMREAWMTCEEVRPGDMIWLAGIDPQNKPGLLALTDELTSMGVYYREMRDLIHAEFNSEHRQAAYHNGTDYNGFSRHYAAEVYKLMYGALHAHRYISEAEGRKLVRKHLPNLFAIPIEAQPKPITQGD